MSPFFMAAEAELIKGYRTEIGEVFEVKPEELLQDRLVRADEVLAPVGGKSEVPHRKERGEHVGVAEPLVLVEIKGFTQALAGNDLALQGTTDDRANELGISRRQNAVNFGEIDGNGRIKEFAPLRLPLFFAQETQILKAH